MKKKEKLKKLSKRHLNILLRTTQELTHKLILSLSTIAGKLHDQLDCIHQIDYCIWPTPDLADLFTLI